MKGRLRGLNEGNLLPTIQEAKVTIRRGGGI